jgi:hypothetical protein
MSKRAGQEKGFAAILKPNKTIKEAIKMKGNILIAYFSQTGNAK